MTNVCPVCCERIFNHALQLKCCACNVVTHMNVSLLLQKTSNPDFKTNWNGYANHVCYIFSQLITLLTINCIDKAATLNESDMIIHPFEINDTDHASALCEIDLDVHFCNSTDTYLSKCNYFDGSGFAQIISNMAKPNGTLSFCHFSIRSIKSRYIPEMFEF